MQDLADPILDQLFRQARSHNAWSDTPIDDAVLERLYDLLKWGPTSANCGPGRFVFVRSPEAKERLPGQSGKDHGRPGLRDRGL